MNVLRSTPVALLLATGLACPAFAAAQGRPHDAHEHAAHEHHDHAALQLQLDAGRRWQTDASLREGMQRIRAALDAAHAGHAGQPRLDAADGRALSAAIDDAIGFMVANCRLPEQADANLHILLGRLGEASARLKQDPTAPQAAGAVGAALDDYARHFDHPGWSPAHHDH